MESPARIYENWSPQMSNHETLRAALLTAFRADVDDTPDEVVADALTSVLVAFANLVRDPVPEVAAAELVADDTPYLILAELQKQTTLLEVLAKQGEVQLQYITDASDPLRGLDTSGLPG
jgi:hypothetical protein